MHSLECSGHILHCKHLTLQLVQMYSPELHHTNGEQFQLEAH